MPQRSCVVPSSFPLIRDEGLNPRPPVDLSTVAGRVRVDPVSLSRGLGVWVCNVLVCVYT